MRGVRFVELDASRRVTRHAVDQVGNNLTAQLLWCAKHVEPAAVDRDDWAPWDYDPVHPETDGYDFTPTIRDDEDPS